MFFISLLLSCILISSNITSNKMVMEKYKIIKTKALYHKEKLIEQLRKMRFYFPFPVPVSDPKPPFLSPKIRFERLFGCSPQRHTLGDQPCSNAIRDLYRAAYGLTGGDVLHHEHVFLCDREDGSG